MVNTLENNKNTDYSDEMSKFLNVVLENTREKQEQINFETKEQEEIPSEVEVNFLVNLFNNKQIELLLIEVNNLKLKFPNFYYLYYLKGLALKEQNKLTNAVIEFKKTLYLKSDFFEASFEEGNIHRTSERYDDAISSYNKSLEMDPTNSKILNNIGMCYLSTENFQLAIQYFEKALKFDPSYLLAYNNLGWVFAKLGETEKTYANFQNAAKYVPNSPEVYKNLASTDLEKGNIKDAITFFLKSLEINPSFIYSLRSLTSIYVQAPELIDIKTRKKIKSLFLKNKYSQDPVVLALLMIFYYSIGKRIKYELILSKFDKCKDTNKCELTSEEDRFLTPYGLFLTSLKNYKWFKTNKKTETIFHIGDSHSLSFGNQLLKIKETEFKVLPKLIIGVKAFHLSQPTQNRYKYFLKNHMLSIPKRSKVLFSVGEIDCRIDEGILLHFKKTAKSLETIIKNTVYGSFNYVNKLNKATNHSIYFLGIPSPVHHKTRESGEYFQLIEIINKFNFHLKNLCVKHNYVYVDTYSITSNKIKNTNNTMFCDNVHLSPNIIDEIETQINN